MIKNFNSWQHLIMSIVTMFLGVSMYMRGVQGVGVGLISLVATTWFVPAVVKQFASQVTEELEAWIMETYGKPMASQRQQHPLQTLEEQKRTGDLADTNEKGEIS